MSFIHSYFLHLRIAFLGALVYVVCFTPLMAASNTLKVVEALRISPTTFTQTMRLIGTLKAKHEAILLAKTQGTVTYIAEAGSKVNKGDLILSLDGTLQSKNLDLAQQSALLAQQKFERAKILYREKVICKAAFENASDQLLEAQTKVTVASLELDKTRFIAPFTGIVGVFKVRTGAQVSEGDCLGTFYDPQNAIVTFDIPGTVLSKINYGQPVMIASQEFSLVGLQKLIDTQTHMAPAYIEFAAKDSILGSHMDVDLVLVRKKDVLVIPQEALVMRNQQQFVFVIENNKAHLRQIKTGLRENDLLEVTEGLKPDEQIVARGTTRLYDGIPVNIAPQVAQ